jgi:hypothetical protein
LIGLAGLIFSIIAISHASSNFATFLVIASAFTFVVGGTGLIAVGGASKGGLLFYDVIYVLFIVFQIVLTILGFFFKSVFDELQSGGASDLESLQNAISEHHQIFLTALCILVALEVISLLFLFCFHSRLTKSAGELQEEYDEATQRSSSHALTWLRALSRHLFRGLQAAGGLENGGGRD